jgi:hypothetical protein
MPENRPKRFMLENVPAKEWGYLAGLKTLLEIRGENISEAVLAGVSGDCFRFHFAPEVLLEGAFVYSENPLRVACSHLGYDYQYTYDQPAGDSLENLKTALAGGGVPLVSFWSTMPEPPSDWDLLVGYDDEKDSLAVRTCQDEILSYSRDEFMERWIEESVTLEGPGDGPEYASQVFFVLDGHNGRDDWKDLFAEALKRASSLLHTESIEYSGRRFYSGFAAYQALADHLNEELPADYASYPPKKIDKLVEAYRAKLDTYQNADTEAQRQQALQELSRVELYRYGEWNCFPLGLLARSRMSAYDFLTEAAKQFKGRDNLVISDAAAHYFVACDLLGKLRWVHPSNSESWSPREDRLDSDNPKLRTKAIKNLAAERKKSAKLVTEILAQEQRALELLESVAGVQDV